MGREEGEVLFWFDAEVEVQREGGCRPSPAMQCCAASANRQPAASGGGGVRG